ncbi:MAG: glycosidase, partial [Flavobacterium sp.]
MNFNSRLEKIIAQYESLIGQKNEAIDYTNGIFQRYVNPVLTAGHAPYKWKYDLDENSNPCLMERIGINAVFNSAAIKFGGKYVLMARVEGSDRKSFFAIAQSDNGIDNFRFWDKPAIIPHLEGETNLYDMRLVQHEDGWIYGVFCTESRDASAPDADQSSAIAQCGIVRTKDLIHWDRLADF